MQSIPLLLGRDPGLGADVEYFLLDGCAQRQSDEQPHGTQLGLHMKETHSHAAILMFSRWVHSRAGISVSRAAQAHKLLTESAEIGRGADFGETNIDCREGGTHVSALYRQTTKQGSGAPKERVQSMQD